MKDTKKISKDYKDLIARFKTLGRKSHTKEDSHFLGRFNKFNDRIKQYNRNNDTNYKQYKIEDFIKSGLYKEFIESNMKEKGFLLKHNKLGYSLDNIFMGNRNTLEKHLVNDKNKFCGICYKILPKDNFKGDNSKYDKLSSNCNKCIQSKNRKTHGLIRRIYNRQRHSSIERNHPPVEYSLDWFRDWVFKQKHFKELYDRWVESGYNKDLTPSIDRINNELWYKKDNIQLMTWKENNIKGSIERWEKRHIRRPKSKYLRKSKKNKGETEMSVNYLVVEGVEYARCKQIQKEPYS